MPILTQNIISASTRKVYGRAGDCVTVVADHDNVAIVQDEAGNRFSVRLECLTDDTTSIETKPLPTPIKDEPVKSRFIQTPTPQKDQLSLF